MASKKETLERLQNAGLHPDNLILKRDGTVEYRHGYFYRHGVTPEKVANDISTALPGAQIIEARDNFNRWPKDSFFSVRFKMPGGK